MKLLSAVLFVLPASAVLVSSARGHDQWLENYVARNPNLSFAAGASARTRKDPVYKNIDRFNTKDCDHSCTTNFPGFVCVNDIHATPKVGLVPCTEVGTYLADACVCSDTPPTKPPTTGKEKAAAPTAARDYSSKSTPGPDCRKAAGCDACVATAFYCQWFIGNSTGGCFETVDIAEERAAQYTHTCGSRNWAAFAPPAIRDAPTPAPELLPTDTVPESLKATYTNSPKIYDPNPYRESEECCAGPFGR